MARVVTCLHVQGVGPDFGKVVFKQFVEYIETVPTVLSTFSFGQYGEFGQFCPWTFGCRVPFRVDGSFGADCGSPKVVNLQLSIFTDLQTWCG